MGENIIFHLQLEVWQKTMPIFKKPHYDSSAKMMFPPATREMAQNAIIRGGCLPAGCGKPSHGMGRAPGRPSHGSGLATLAFKRGSPPAGGPWHPGARHGGARRRPAARRRRRPPPAAAGGRKIFFSRARSRDRGHRLGIGRALDGGFLWPRQANATGGRGRI